MAIVNLNANEIFSPDCSRCARLAQFLETTRRNYPTYYAKAVPTFGVGRPRLLVVGLAPGLHGANRTGRPFTGDYAGLLLYRTLHKYGFATADASISSDDGLRLIDCRITNAVRCVPPQNKPNSDEVKRCNGYLQQELAGLDAASAVLALGSVAHAAVLRALALRQTDYRFGHAAEHILPGERWLIDSYHCSRYNTQTRRLTEAMFQRVFEVIRMRLDRHGPGSTAQPAA